MENKLDFVDPMHKYVEIALLLRCTVGSPVSKKLTLTHWVGAYINRFMRSVTLHGSR